jgi:hypothetical protein
MNTIIEYDEVYPFSEELTRVRLNDKWGFIDETGKEIIPCKYDDARSFSHGCACVKIEGNEIYIDKQGNEYSMEADAIEASLNGELQD